jgi:OPA family sugar phosphate sensor protein UhpC-like MFS transporter
VLCVLVAAWLFAWMQDRPRTLGLPTVGAWRNDQWQAGTAPEAVATTTAQPLLRSQLTILARPAIWLLALASATNYIVRYAINSWGVLYLQEARGYSLVEAGSFLMANTLAGIVGCIAFGYISDKLFQARRPPTNLLFALLEIVALLLVFYGPQSSGWLLFAFVLYGVGMNGLVTSLGGLFGTDIVSKRTAGAVMGIIGVFSYVGAAIQENITGLLVDGGLSVVDGVRIYDFSAAINFWLGAAVVSALLAACLWRVRLQD